MAMKKQNQATKGIPATSPVTKRLGLARLLFSGLIKGIV